MKTKLIIVTAALVCGPFLASAQQPVSPPTKGARSGAEQPKGPDTNGDGLISRAEAEAGAPRFARHFDKIDTNRDGMLSPEEIATWQQQRRAGVEAKMKNEREQRFRDADKNRDGFISRDEANTSLPRAAKDFDALDTNKDGKLSMDELSAGRPGKPAGKGQPEASPAEAEKRR